jgi:hypothetical protein
MTKISENYHATLKNPTSHGGVRGIFMSKNTTQNSIFFENPTPRGGILKYHESDPTRGEISIEKVADVLFNISFIRFPLKMP